MPRTFLSAMKATLKASLYAATSLVLLASCYGPGGPRPPGLRGYTLDRPPGRYGNQQPPPPASTSYLEPTAPIPGDRTTAVVQPPNPNAPITIDTVTPPPTTTPDQPAAPTVPPVTAPPPTVVKPPAPTASLPTASRTKAGFVKSPFDPLGREIDVREMRSGQKARCPYTQKVFLVP